MPDHPAAKSLRDDVASYRANGTIITDETLRGWERRLTKLAFPGSTAAEFAPTQADLDKVFRVGIWVGLVCGVALGILIGLAL